MKCGHVKRTLSVKILLDVAVSSWFDRKLLPDSLMVWAVVSRGCISKDEICKLRGMTINQLEQNLKEGVLFLF